MENVTLRDKESFAILGSMKNSPLLILICLLLVKAIALGILIATYHAGLSPDEAQYWTWSQQLDWGYYSKPPAIAWQIWGTTSLFGHTPLGIRVGALAIAFLLAVAVYYLALACGLSEKKAFWAGIVMAFSPLGFYLSLAATTDGGAILFLTVGIYVIARGLRTEEGPNYPLAGVWILLGALYKWTAFILWPIALFFFIFFPKMRKGSIVWGILISLAAFLPPLYWNMTHDWATFKHVGGALGTGARSNFFDFLAAQIGLFSPVFFAMLIAAYCALWRQSNRALLFCGAFPLVALFYLGASVFNKIQPNWALYLYPPAMVLIAWAPYPRYKIWLHIGTWFSILMVCVALFLPWYAFRQTLGWDRLAPVLEEAGYDPDTEFLMSNKYQTVSLLSFYGPEKKRAYFFNVSNSRKNQFSYWDQMHQKEVGETGYFVVIEKTSKEALPLYEKEYLARLKPYFEDVSYVGAYPLYSYKGKPVKYAIIFKGERYLGEAPEDPEEY